MDQSNIRALVARMQKHIDVVATGTPAAPELGELARTWNLLVQQLALGPIPETRACPKCKNEIIRQATRCRYCWAKVDAAPHGAA